MLIATSCGALPPVSIADRALDPGELRLGHAAREQPLAEAGPLRPAADQPEEAGRAIEQVGDDLLVEVVPVGHHHRVGRRRVEARLVDERLPALGVAADGRRQPGRVHPLVALVDEVDGERGAREHRAERLADVAGAEEEQPRALVHHLDEHVDHPAAALAEPGAERVAAGLVLAGGERGAGVVEHALLEVAPADGAEEAAVFERQQARTRFTRHRAFDVDHRGDRDWLAVPGELRELADPVPHPMCSTTNFAYTRLPARLPTALPVPRPSAMTKTLLAALPVVLLACGAPRPRLPRSATPSSAPTT